MGLLRIRDKKRAKILKRGSFSLARYYRIILIIFISLV